MRTTTIHPKILALSDEDFRDWFAKRKLRGKPDDYRPKKKKSKKKEEGGA